MSNYETLLAEQDGGVLQITLNRPQKYNALTYEMSQEIVAVCKRAFKDDSVRCLLLTGAGKGFCAGQDLGEVGDRDLSDFSFHEHLERGYNRMVTSMRRLEKPIVGAINGACAGAGLGLALATDIRYASDRAVFLTAFIGIGLVPDSGVSYWLPRLVGPARAAEMLFTNDKIDGARAAEIGLVNRVVPHEQLLENAQALAHKLATGPTLGIGLTKRLLAKSMTNTLEQQLDYEGHLQDVAGHSQDYQEGVSAFREKRKPTFSGR